MGRLTDILGNGDGDSLRDAWNSTEAAAEFAPLPPGEYIAHVASGELFNAKSGTPGYKLAFRIADGEHTGRKLWHDLWLTPAATAMSKRDLAKIGITSLPQLEQPVPRGISCAVKVALRKSDSGGEYNSIRSFAVIGIDPPPADTFAPPDDGSTPPAEGTERAEADGPGATPAAAADTF